MSATAIVTPPVSPTPAEFHEVFTVTSGQALGIRLTKDKNRVTNVDGNSPLTGKLFVGDRVVALDGARIANGEQLRKRMKKVPQQPTRVITVEHGTWSFCTHVCTTVEKILMDKDNDKLTGRAINIYQIVIKVMPTPESNCFPIDLQVRYDARERLMVAWVDPNSITAIHLRPGDIIRDVNGKAVASKAMLRSYMLMAAQKGGRINLVVESDAGGNDAYRDTVEMAADVVNIVSKHMNLLKEKKAVPAKGCLSKGPRKKDRMVTIAPEERQLVTIASDYDTAKLKPCKGAKQ